jgi:hypothetical protein
VAFGSAAARLMRAYATQVEVLRRLRSGGQQFVLVEHVHMPIEMRVLDRYPVNEFGFDHSKALGCSESAQDHRAGQAALVPPAIQRPPQRG